MDAEFWHERWQRREIGFHKDEVHPFLQRFFPQLELPADGRVLVPLCGKSLDLLWLRSQGYTVIGVELSRMAVEEFFHDIQQTPMITTQAGYRCYELDQLQILCGDLFSLRPQQIGPVAAIYDRAALVALPPAMRSDYAAKLLDFLPAGGEMLTISYDYPQDEMTGPPFSVPEAEICSLFAAECALWKLHSESTLGMHMKMQQAGLRSLQEEVYRLQRR